MGKPPDDDIWEGVLSQVHEALDSLNLGDSDTREALLEGVRQALEASISIDDGPEGPQVVLLDGGLRTDEIDKRDLSDQPELHVLGSDDGDDLGGVVDGRVRVYRVDGSRMTGADPRSLGGDADMTLRKDQEHTIFRGDAPRPYRMICDEGDLEIAADGAWIELLHTGQTTDVEARIIRVRGAADIVRGRYTRL